MDRSDRSDLLSGGIFARETGQRLIQIFGRVTDRAFMGLYTKCKHDLRGRYYQTGLRRVHAWSDEVLQEDIDSVQQSCPDMLETYEQCFNDYVVERYGSGKKTSMRCPPIVEFTRRFLECIGEHDVMMSGVYFSARNGVDNKMGCIDAARQAMYTLLTTENVRVELESQISATPATRPEYGMTSSPVPSPTPSRHETYARSEVSKVSHASQHTTGTQTNTPRNQQKQLNVNLEDDVQPEDSISQIGNQSEVRRSYGDAERSLRNLSAQRETDDDDLPQGSVVSRHDFADEEAVVVPSWSASKLSRPPMPKSSTRDGKVSSGDSSVSIGMKRIKSPASVR
jgi:hypothetical protein